MSQSKIIFALDTGTRSVIGIIAEVKKTGLNILASVKEEHEGRAMLDGQIHDIDHVAILVKSVKDQLEEKIGYPLKKVAVAAAGRALETVHGKVEREFNPLQAIAEDEARSLELEAVRSAQKALAEGQKKSKEKFYCVGYSVINYYLEQKTIGNPVGQRGSSLGVELIATFLPQVVVDSLITVLEKTGLELEMMTLEPIAAIEAIIPQTMRKLNLALVDIGAGTSDIALTAKGSITGYAMVPLAGDEVTERLCEVLLLDFLEGEKVKRELLKSKTVSLTNILGMNEKKPSKKIIASTRDTVNEIASEIGKAILSINQVSPQAVICVGGGSLTPCLTEELAAFLGLPSERVGLRDPKAINNIEGLPPEIAGPDGVTPLGIALMAARKQLLGLTQLKVNNLAVRLFRGPEASVADALLAADLGFADLCGPAGQSLAIEVNGEKRIIKGGLGAPARITLNGEPATLDTPLPLNADIQVGESIPGKDASPTLKELLPQDIPLRKIYYLGLQRELLPLIYMNGLPAKMDTPVSDRAHISWSAVRTVRDALLVLGFSEADLKYRCIGITLNGKTQEVSFMPLHVFINEEQAMLDSEIPEDAVLDVRQADSPKLRDIFKKEELFLDKNLKIFVNGKVMSLPYGGFNLLRNGIEAQLDDFLIEGDVVETRSGSDFKPIFADIFKVFNFDETPPHPAAHLVTMVNGLEAQFTTTLKEGDKIRIFWKHENLLQNIAPK